MLKLHKDHAATKPLKTTDLAQGQLARIVGPANTTSIGNLLVVFWENDH